MSSLSSFIQLNPDRTKNKSLWGLAIMSFLSGTASVMVFSVLSMFMREELHLSFQEVGHIEGFAIFIAFLAKIFSGVVSDRIQSRKSLILVGAIGSALVKPIFALTTGIYGTFMAKSLDRFVKGIRAAPTDALVGDLSALSHEGISYGARYALYALGFMCGGAAASCIMYLSNNNFRLVFWLALIPAILACLILHYTVTDPLSQKKKEKAHSRWKWRDISSLPKSFWHLMVVTFLLMNARFSEAFLHFRGRELGYAIAMMPLFMMLYNFLEALAPLPMGKLADRFNRQWLLLWGILALVLANAVLLIFPFKGMILVSIALVGLHMGMTQGLLGTLIASSTQPNLRGTAFALFYLVAGIAAPMGNFIAGYMAEWSNSLGYGVQGAFVWGLISTCLATGYLGFRNRNQY